MVELDLIVEEDAWSEIPDLESVCQTAFDAAVKVEPAEGIVALLLADNDVLHGLNRQFRSKDKPTDVLSFPADPMDRPMLGDIAVALGVAKEDATAQNKTLADRSGRCRRRHPPRGRWHHRLQSWRPPTRHRVVQHQSTA